MEKVNNNFDERLKQYSEEIKSMEIVYQNGRVKYINKKNMINLKNRNIQDESRCIKSENQEKDFYTNDEEYSSFKNMYSLILKFIFTCIIFISMPFVANKIANVGVNEFVSGIGTIFISCSIKSLTKSSPGSDIAGVPASETKAKFLPSSNNERTCSDLTPSLCL